jgi:hypothetical protein
MSGQRHLQEARHGNRYELANDNGVLVSVAVDAHQAALEDRPGDGSSVSPRNVALQHQVEVSGERDFSFAIEAEAR